MKLPLHPACPLALAGLLVGTAQADIVWTGAMSNDIFDEANWDLTNSSVTVVDPNVTIMDNVVIANAPNDVEIPDLPGGQFRFEVGENFSFTLDNSRIVAVGNDGIGCFAGTGIGFTIDVINGAALDTFFVVNEVTVDIDATSTSTFGGGGNPVNLSFINMTTGSVLAFLLEDPTEFLNEHLNKVTVDGIPAVVGQNINVVSDGATGSIVTVIPQTLGTSYCTANPNSTMATASMSASGSATAANNDVTLMCESMPNNSFAFFLTSQTQSFVANPGGSSGNLCLGGAIGRYVGTGQIQNSGAVGTVDLALDLNSHPTPNGLVSVAAGETWNFQCWFRDTGLLGATSNFSDGLEILFN